MRPFLAGSLWLLALSSSVFAEDFPDADLEFFEKQIRPLLVTHCYECHSAESDDLEGGLRLDSRAGLIRGGDTGTALVPKNPKASRIIEAISYGNVDLQMPPDGKLKPAVVGLLTEWVKRGAPWPDEKEAPIHKVETFDLEKRKASHWCWQAIKDYPAPPVKNRDWVSQPLDRYLLAKLEAAGLTPADPADRRTLIRRAYFDLIGLPPSPSQVEAFASDDSPQAFARVVDHLLDSPHFGERWARHWMDLVRYAESHGHEFDYPIHNAYRYRDYLIRAFNRDVPYDQFIIEHIAGDLVVKPRRHPETLINESVIGTAFWWLGEATHSPVDVKGDEAGRIDNQLDVVGKAFLGLTIACARCHDHKFDAISTKDYYALAGFLQSSRRHETLLDPQGRIAKTANRMRQLKATGEKLLIDGVADSLTGDDFSRYLLAAREVMHGDPEPDDAAQGPKKDIIFEDFEKETYEGWTVEGTAFGPGPQTQKTIGRYQGDVAAAGSRFVNSHNIRPGGDVKNGDNLLGRMLSPAFTIERRFITFLVGGGAHKDRTCVNLLVNGKRVRTQTGFNHNRMRPAKWDVGDLRGIEARIEILDQQKGGWGNIGADHFVFTDQSKPTRRPIATVAQEQELDAARLAKWVTALSDDSVKRVSHPLHLWSIVAAAKGGQVEKTIAEQRARFATEAKRLTDLNQTHPLLADFEESAAGWFLDGEAFSNGSSLALNWNWQRGRSATLPSGVIGGGTVSRRLQGVLRSPTFVLNHGSIYLRVRGDGVTVRLIPDGYYMNEFNGLLFGGFKFDLNDGADFKWHRMAGDIHRYKGHRCYLEFIDHGDGWIEIDEIRTSDQGSPSEPASRLSKHILVDGSLDSIDSLAASYGKSWSNPVGRRILLSWVTASQLNQLPPKMSEKLAALRAELQKLSASLPSPQRVLGLTEGTPENEFIFIRGNHRTPGTPAKRQLLEAIVGGQPAISSGSGRLQLAQQIASPQNPLTARVMVNRLWHHLFGRGIVASTDNFGVLGQQPTHPELLDHLALRLINNDWSIKKTLREIMLSSTYRMASTPDPAKAELDPENRLLHRQRIRRLQGEAIRDAILAVSGRLDRTQFGPSVPVHVTSFMTGRGRPRGGPLDGAGRRSIYGSIRRNFLSPMMLAFDMPIPFNPVGRRNASNVPSQALILMNDPFVVEQAKVWARRIMQGKNDSIESRIQQMYVTAFARKADSSQVSALVTFLKTQQAEYGIDDDKVLTDERLWADLGHVLINTKPFIYLY